MSTPVNWKNGDDVIIVPAVSNEEAKEKYPDGWKQLSLICASYLSRVMKF